MRTVVYIIIFSSKSHMITLCKSLFRVSDAKHQRKKSQMQTQLLTVNRVIKGVFTVSDFVCIRDFFHWCLTILNVNSTVKISGTHLLATPRPLTQTLTVNRPGLFFFKLLDNMYIRTMPPLFRVVSLLPFVVDFECEKELCDMHIRKCKN